MTYRPSFPAARALVLAGLALFLSGCALRQDARIWPTVPGTGVTVFAAGDIADCRRHFPADSGAARTADLIASHLAKDDKAVVLALGDLTYPVGAAAEYTHCYEPTWGRFKAKTFPSPGNHDYHTKGASGYYDYFGERAGPARRGYYSFTLGNWLILSLNSSVRGAELDAQLAWLKKELAQNTSKCTLAYWHHPVFSSGGHGSLPVMQPFWKELAAAGTELVLAAHDHDYERFAPQDGDGLRDEARGTRQFVVGTGGAHLTPLRLDKPHSETNDNTVYGVLKLTLKETGYEWEFLPATEGGYTDRGAAPCH